MFSSTLACLITLGSFFLPVKTDNDSVFRIFLSDKDIDGWLVHNEYRHYCLDELSEYSRGLVDMYSEYKLKEVLTVSYIDPENENIIKVEAYLMNDHSGAYGLFSVSRKNAVIPAGHGDESYKNDKFIYFWKGNYYVKVYSYSDNKLVREGINKVASAIDKNIDEEGKRPEIIKLLPEESFVTERTKYFQGEAGLNFSLPFGREDIYGFKEGVYGDFGTHGLLILKYECEETRKLFFDKITGSLNNSKRYSEMPGNKDYHYFIDKDENIIVFGDYGIYIMIYIGEDITRQPEIFERIEDAALNHYPETLN